MQRLHATCVAFHGKALLLTGPSRCGKSDLALRLIALGAELVADDQVELHLRDAQIEPRAPAAILGMIEARYLGLLTLDRTTQTARLAAVIQPGTPERLPEPAQTTLLGLPFPLLTLPYLEASSAIKLKLFLEHAL